MAYMLGKKRDKGGVVPSLLKITSMWIRDHIHVDSVNHIISFVPDELLEIVLDGCPPEQLAKIEHFAQRDLSEVTEVLWQKHCTTFANKEELTEKESFDTWREYYQELVRQYEDKKAQVGKHIRSLYDERAKEKASKKIKVLEATPVAKSRYGFGSTANVTYSRAVSKPMAKCLKDMKKSQATMAWKKPVQSSQKPVVTGGSSLSHSKLLNIPSHKFIPPSKQPPKLLTTSTVSSSRTISSSSLTTKSTSLPSTISSLPPSKSVISKHALTPSKSPLLPSPKSTPPSSRPNTSIPSKLPTIKPPQVSPNQLASHSKSASSFPKPPQSLPKQPSPQPKCTSLFSNKSPLPPKPASLPPKSSTHSTLAQKIPPIPKARPVK